MSTQNQTSKEIQIDWIVNRLKNGYAKNAPKFVALCLGIYEDEESEDFELELVNPRLITNLDEVLSLKDFSN